MTLRKTKLVTNVLAVCAAFCAIASYITMEYTALTITLLVLTLVLTIAMAAIKIIFWRCPYCEKSLGRDSGKFCQHCGKALNMDL